MNFTIYPLVVSCLYPQNGKNDYFVWYRQCTFFIDTIFSHVYQFGASRMIFLHFLTAYKCTQIKIKHHFFLIIWITEVESRNKDIIFAWKINCKRTWCYLWWSRHITDTISLGRGAWYFVYIRWWSRFTLIRWDCAITTKLILHGLFVCFGRNKTFMKLFDDLSKTRPCVFF